MTTPNAVQHQDLAQALQLNSGGPSAPHVVIALPSFSVGESLLAHYGERLAPLEHRYLLAHLMLNRIDDCEVVFITAVAPEEEVLAYYRALVREERREALRTGLHVVEVADRTVRPVAAKLLARPDLIAQLREHVGDRPALIEPWNVTEAETELARQLGFPINGTPPELWPLGFKSAGRRLMAGAGVPVPPGREDLHGAEEVLAAIAELRRERPDATGLVVKSDDAGAGDGNRVLRFDRLDGPDALRAEVLSWPDWYQADLEAGCVVEELICGEAFTSPSVQVDLPPDGEPVVLSTHEQILGGPGGQVYLGCRFPAEPAYARRLAEQGAAVGRALCREGALGRVGVDFAAALQPDGHWDVYALEINLRKGGTTHPFSALRNLVPGRYDREEGRWVTEEGSTRCYVSTDNLVDPTWVGRRSQGVIDAIAEAGLEFECSTGRGVVLHMLSGLAVDGRFGLTAIGTSADDAEGLYDGAVTAVRQARDLSRRKPSHGEQRPT
ncbi:MAG TPA: peptide ligase PGM1-related protein [Mycobacteriales bacterium]|nr:peptide ligase PGM1-related protein [Mycobacteriales bacterium]